VQAEQSGSPAVPPRIGPVSPHPAHRIQRCLQARHHGLPVALEIAHGASFPQIPQVRIFPGTQFAHSGPPGARTLTGRRRPQPAQVSWLAGSVIRHWEHSGWPCSSRAATGNDFH